MSDLLSCPAVLTVPARASSSAHARTQFAQGSRLPALALGGLLAALSLSSRAAAAQGSQAETAANRAELLLEAQRLVNAASERYRNGAYEQALEALRAAEPLAEQAGDPSLPSIRFNIARCLEQLDRPKEALAAYERYDALPDAPHRKEKAFSAMRALERRVFAQLFVSCAPVGAAVEVPGLSSGTHPCPWQVPRAEPGKYEVKVSAPGHADETRSVTLEAGKSTNVQVALLPNTPSGSSEELSVATEAEGKGLSPWPFVAFGSAAALVGGGVAFTVLASDDRDTAESQPPGSARDDAVSSFETNRAVSYALYGVGGAAAITGLVLLFLPLDGEDPSTTEGGVAPAVRVRPSPFGLTVQF